jgi:hypothetical protein
VRANGHQRASLVHPVHRSKRQEFKRCPHCETLPFAHDLWLAATCLHRNWQEHAGLSSAASMGMRGPARGAAKGWFSGRSASAPVCRRCLRVDETGLHQTARGRKCQVQFQLAIECASETSRTLNRLLAAPPQHHQRHLIIIYVTIRPFAPLRCHGRYLVDGLNAMDYHMPDGARMVCVTSPQWVRFKVRKWHGSVPSLFSSCGAHCIS